MKKVGFFVVAAILVATVAWAEDKLGVPVYPGAKFDAVDTKTAKQLVTDAACYQCVDNIAKVVDFYKKQAGLKLLTPPKGVSSPATAFQKGKDVQVRVQSLPAKANEIHICIVKE